MPDIYSLSTEHKFVCHHWVYGDFITEGGVLILMEHGTLHLRPFLKEEERTIFLSGTWEIRSLSTPIVTPDNLGSNFPIVSQRIVNFYIQKIAILPELKILSMQDFQERLLNHIENK